MTVPSPRDEAAPLLWRLVRRHLRGRRANRASSDAASATMASYVVGASVFIIGSSFLFNFALQPAKVADLESNTVEAAGNAALDLLLGTPGYPTDWNVSAEATTNAIKRLGLIASGSTVRLDPDKFERLVRGSYSSPNSTDDYVDYHEAKLALGLEGYDFHIRVFPKSPLATEDNYGIVGMGNYSVAYVGDYVTTATPSDSAIQERYLLDRLDIAFNNSTRTTLGGTGDAFPDDSGKIRDLLIPLLGTGVPQADIASTGSTQYDFHRVTAAQASTIVTDASSYALGLFDGADTFGYDKSREMRVTLGVANFSGLASAIVSWNEYVNTGDNYETRDDGDYGFLELSPDDGATWYPITNNAAERSQDSPNSPFLGNSFAARAATVTSLNCAACFGSNSVQVAFHWVADGDNKKGDGWIVDEVAISSSGFYKDFEAPHYDLLVIGSHVDQNALTPTEIKNGIRDFVELYGGRLVVLGGDQNINWLQPLFHVGIRDASPTVATPDKTHPLLTTPNEMDYGEFQTDGNEWDFSSSDDEHLFDMVVGTTTGHTLAVSVSDAFGGGEDGGAIILTTFLPYTMDASAGTGFLANSISYGRFHYLHGDIGPEVPTNEPVVTITRSATMDKSKTNSGDYVDLSFVLYLWRGNATSQGSASAITIPFAPTATAWAQPGQVQVNWTPDSYIGTSNLIGFNIYRANTEGLGTVYRELTDPAQRTFLDTNVSNGLTYYYFVRAVNSAGAGYASREVNATPVTTPGAPSTPSVVGGAGSYEISWLAPGDTGGASITNYELWSGPNEASMTFLQDVGLVTSKTLNGMPPDERTYFKVRANNTLGEGAFSAAGYGDTTSLPPAPTGLAAVGSLDNVALAWDAIPLAAEITNFTIHRGIASGSYTQLATVSASNATFLDLETTAGQIYYYVIQANNVNGQSGYSTEVAATRLGLPAKPTAVATPGSGAEGRVNLLITDPVDLGGASEVLWYHVHRKPASGGYTLVANITASASGITDWNDTGLTAGAQYTYTATAVTEAGAGEVSLETTTTASIVPAATVLTVDSVISRVGLSWVTVGNATGYVISRGTEPLALSPLATIGTNTTYDDMTTQSGEQYYYAVAAINDAGTGDDSNTVTATMITQALPPTVLAIPTSGGKVTLNITAPLDDGGSAITSYRIERAVTTPVTWTHLSPDPAYTSNPQNYVNSGLSILNAYYYQVYAINAAGTSTATLVGPVTPLP